ncbi:MAG: class I SAM-dependent methyltransferase [Pseudomonadota bacterium]
MTGEENGWVKSADAWIADMGHEGDFGRKHILDTPMLARAALAAERGGTRALDVGCGEGRFCRMLAGRGWDVIGLDPVPRMLQAAQSHTDTACYVRGHGERLPFESEAFHLVVSYLSLLDLDGFDAAVAEMARVSAPGGSVLVANLNPFVTANPFHTWIEDGKGGKLFPIDHYPDARADWVGWRGIHVRNWHRPLETTMSAFIGAGLTLTHYGEPLPTGGDPARVARQKRVLWFHIMEWAKPAERP